MVERWGEAAAPAKPGHASSDSVVGVKASCRAETWLARRVGRGVRAGKRGTDRPDQAGRGAVLQGESLARPGEQHLESTWENPARESRVARRPGLGTAAGWRPRAPAP